MKVVNLLLLASVACAVHAQVQIKPLPEKGFEKRIHNAVYDIRLIDTHEHLMSEKQALSGASDFTCLFENYQNCDMTSSNLLANIPSASHWENISTAWEAAKSTGYGRASLLAAKELFDIDDLNADTHEELSARIKASHKPGYYTYVLKEKAKIDMVITMVGSNAETSHEDKSFFKSLMYTNGFCYLSDEFNKYTFSFERARTFHNKFSNDVRTLSDYEEMMDKAFRAGIGKGIIGFKNSWCYSRTMQTEEVSRENAEKIFNRMVADPKREFTLDEVKPLQDYLFFKVLSLCEKYGMPIQIHTGLQTYNGNYITNTNPTLLTNVFFKFPKVKFILLHAAYPYGGELAALAKNFPNVYIDLAWAPIICPSYSIRYLQEFLETVPSNKISVFGGDVSSVEGTYGASVMAREVVEKCLVAMVRSGYFTEKEATVLANKLLRENAIRMYDLKL